MEGVEVPSTLKMILVPFAFQERVIHGLVVRWLIRRRGGLGGDAVAQVETWWLSGRRGGLVKDVVA